MRQHVLRTLLFVAGLILIMEITQVVLLAALRHKRTGSYGVWNRIVQGQVNADILISGSSRALVNFDSELIGSRTGLSCYSIGIDGSRLEAQRALLKMYLKHNRPPRFLVQVVDIMSLEQLTAVYEPSLYVPYLNDPNIFQYVMRVDRSFLARKYLPLYSFALDRELLYGALHVMLGREDESLDNRRSGFQGRDIEWDESFDRFFVKVHSNGVNYAVQAEAIGQLEDMIKLAQQSGSRVILVYPPEYFKNFELTRNRAEIISVFADVASRRGIPFWDFSGNPICWDRSAFFNSQHLNLRGADQFSADFADQLKKQEIDKTDRHIRK